MSGVHISVRHYAWTWAVLVLLSAATLLLSRIDLGAWSVAASLAIAGVKAALVLLVFMHLAEQRWVNALAILVMLVLLAVLVALTGLDVATRLGPALRPPVGG